MYGYGQAEAQDFYDDQARTKRKQRRAGEQKARKLEAMNTLDLGKLTTVLYQLRDLAEPGTKPTNPVKHPGFKNVVFVSNYDSTRVGMYVGGILQHEEHGDSYKHGVAYTYFLLKGKRKKIQWEDFFRHAADLFTCAGTPFDWREADPSWLRRRKHFPSLLGEVKFNAALVGNN